MMGAIEGGVSVSMGPWGQWGAGQPDAYPALQESRDGEHGAREVGVGRPQGTVHARSVNDCHDLRNDHFKVNC